MTRVIMVRATVVLAACAAEQPAPDLVAAAARLDQARAEIAPPLGATTYTLDHCRLLDQPGGENSTVARALEQLPGVTLGPNGKYACAVSSGARGALAFPSPASLRLHYGRHDKRSPGSADQG